VSQGEGGSILGRADALSAAGDREGAEALVAAQLRATPSDPALHTWLAKQRWMAGDREYARDLHAVLRTASHDRALWQARIALDLQAEDYTAALETIGLAERATGAPWTAHRATCLDELGEHAAAAALFATLDPRGDPSVAVRIARHRLRSGEHASAYAVCEPWLGTPHAETLWPYVALAWRCAGDARWQWLEGREGLIGVNDEVLPAPHIDELASAVRALHTAVRQPIDQSLRGGTQTPGHLLERPEPIFSTLRAALADAVADHIAGLPPRDPFHPTLRHPRDRPLRFSGSWSVRLVDGGRHAAHVHNAGWLSSALYLALPDIAGDADPAAGFLELGAPPAELNLGLAPIRTVVPRAGRLALFPSTMWHGTRPFAAGERLTIAFDVAPPR